MDDFISVISDILSDRYKGTVYHYTNVDGLSGIVGNHEIWMSNIFFMNDKTEFKALTDSQSILDKNDFQSEYMRYAWTNFYYRRSFFNTYYLASFSRSKDLLEQWRAYGSFCIGFDVQKLNLKKGVSLHKCLYRSADIKKWILKFDKSNIWDAFTEKDDKIFLASIIITLASAKFKNWQFRNEKEVRLITRSNHNWTDDRPPRIYENDHPIHTTPHSKHGFPVPFVKYYIHNDANKITSTESNEKEMEMKARKLQEERSKERRLLPITEVIIGPIAYQKEAKVACEILLAEKGYKKVKVSLSNIPYRGL